MNTESITLSVVKKKYNNNKGFLLLYFTKNNSFYLEFDFIDFFTHQSNI